MMGVRVGLCCLVVAGCVGGEVLPLPPLPSGAKLGVFGAGNGYETFVDPEAVSARAVSADDSGFVRYYACDLATLAISPSGVFGEGEGSTLLPASDATFAVSWAPAKFNKVVGPSTLDQLRVPDLAAPTSCIESTNAQTFTEYAGAIHVYDPEEGALIGLYRDQPRLFFKDGRMVEVDSDFAEIVRTARNPSSGRIFVLVRTNTVSLTAYELDSIPPSPGATRVRWEVLQRYPLQDQPLLIRRLSVSGADPVICTRSDGDPSEVQCDGPGVSTRDVAASTGLVAGRDGVYRQLDFEASRVTASGVERLDTEPLRGILVDGYDRGYGVATNGNIWRLDGEPRPDPDLARLETAYREISVGDFGVITLGTLGVQWLRPLGFGTCTDFPIFNTIVTARDIVIVEDLDRGQVIWIDPIGREPSDRRSTCPLPAP